MGFIFFDLFEFEFVGFDEGERRIWVFFLLLSAAILLQMRAYGSTSDFLVGIHICEGVCTLLLILCESLPVEKGYMM